MYQINRAIGEVRRLAELAGGDGGLNRIHPLAKLLVTVFYIGAVVSFTPEQITGLSGMSVYPIVLFAAGEISFRDSLHRLRVVLPLVCCVGLLNPFFDREIIFRIGGIGISAGVVSMMTLMIKGILTVLAAYLLMVTTTIESICYALRLLHVPKLFVTVVLLIYRYISLLMEETHRMMQAYALRAPAQKGIQWRVWGSFAGMLLLRSIDRAQQVYESMCLRGFQGAFYLQQRAFGITDAAYMGVWLLVLIVFRVYPVFSVIGKLFL